MATKKGRTRIFFHPSLLYLFLDPESEIRDPGSEIRDRQKPGYGIRDKHPGSATLKKSVSFLTCFVNLDELVHLLLVEDERDVLEWLVHGEEDGLAVKGEPPVHPDLHSSLAQLTLGFKNKRCCGSGSSIWRSMRIRLRIQDFDEQKFKKLHIWTKIYTFWSKLEINLYLRLHKGRPNYRRSLQHSEENIQRFKTWYFLTFFIFLFLGIIFAFQFCKKRLFTCADLDIFSQSLIAEFKLRISFEPRNNNCSV